MGGERRTVKEASAAVRRFVIGQGVGNMVLIFLMPDPVWGGEAYCIVGRGGGKKGKLAANIEEVK